MTYMNRSGLAVGEAVTFYKLNAATDLMVLVDDVALPVGRIRLRGEGSAGGHNGLGDIQQALGTTAYPRPAHRHRPAGAGATNRIRCGAVHRGPVKQAGAAARGAALVKRWSAGSREGLPKAMTEVPARKVWQLLI